MLTYQKNTVSGTSLTWNKEERQVWFCFCCSHFFSVVPQESPRTLRFGRKFKLTSHLWNFGHWTVCIHGECKEANRSSLRNFNISYLQHSFLCSKLGLAHQGPSLDSAPKVHKSSILYKEFNKEKISCENTDLGSMPLCSFGKRNLPGKYGEPQKQTKGFTMDSLIF